MIMGLKKNLSVFEYVPLRTSVTFQRLSSALNYPNGSPQIFNSPSPKNKPPRLIPIPELLELL